MKLSTLHVALSMLNRGGAAQEAAAAILHEEFNGAIELQLPLQPKAERIASVSTKRVKAFRDRQKRVSETHETLDETPGETFHETISGPPSSSPSESRISSSSHVFSESQTPAGEEATESQDRKKRVSETPDETVQNAVSETQRNGVMKRSAGSVSSFTERAETELRRKPLKDAEMAAKARSETERLERVMGGKP